MRSHIVDNRKIRVADCLHALLSDGATSASFAVGYLFIDGLVPLREHIAQLDDVEILIGNVINRLTQEQIREETDGIQRGGESWVLEQADFASTLRGVHDHSAAVTALNLRGTLQSLPREPEVRELLLTMAGRIADGRLKIRLYTQGRIHAKISIVRYPPDHQYPHGLALVGSSNPTLGTAGHPTEMNVLVDDGNGVRDLQAWFRELWDTAQDFQRNLFDELGQSWALS